MAISIIGAGKNKVAVKGGAKELGALLSGGGDMVTLELLNDKQIYFNPDAVESIREVSEAEAKALGAEFGPA